jgi:hypothetical protein
MYTTLNTTPMRIDRSGAALAFTAIEVSHLSTDPIHVPPSLLHLGGRRPIDE